MVSEGGRVVIANGSQVRIAEVSPSPAQPSPSLVTTPSIVKVRSSRGPVGSLLSGGREWMGNRFGGAA